MLTIRSMCKGISVTAIKNCSFFIRLGSDWRRNIVYNTIFKIKLGTKVTESMLKVDVLFFVHYGKSKYNNTLWFKTILDKNKVYRLIVWNIKPFYSTRLRV